MYDTYSPYKRQICTRTPMLCNNLFWIMLVLLNLRRLRFSDTQMDVRSHLICLYIEIHTRPEVNILLYQIKQLARVNGTVSYTTYLACAFKSHILQTRLISHITCETRALEVTNWFAVRFFVKKLIMHWAREVN
jgi:hypothetical protein